VFVFTFIGSLLSMGVSVTIKRPVDQLPQTAKPAWTFVFAFIGFLLPGIFVLSVVAYFATASDQSLYVPHIALPALVFVLTFIAFLLSLNFVPLNAY
jgi:energy-coupling factor transporter transmembrane protein EcfT